MQVQPELPCLINGFPARISFNLRSDFMFESFGLCWVREPAEVIRPKGNRGFNQETMDKIWLNLCKNHWRLNVGNRYLLKDLTGSGGDPLFSLAERLWAYAKQHLPRLVDLFGTVYSCPAGKPSLYPSSYLAEPLLLSILFVINFSCQTISLLSSIV